MPKCDLTLFIKIAIYTYIFKLQLDSNIAQMYTSHMSLKLIFKFQTTITGSVPLKFKSSRSMFFITNEINSN